MNRSHSFGQMHKDPPYAREGLGRVDREGEPEYQSNHRRLPHIHLRRMNKNHTGDHSLGFYLSHHILNWLDQLS